MSKIRYFLSSTLIDKNRFDLSYYRSGSFCSLNEVLNNFVRGVSIEVDISFSTLEDMPTGPGGLLSIIIPNWSYTSFSVIGK